MFRLIAILLGLCGIASPSLAQTLAPKPSREASDAPERLLPPSSQLYIRWDGITAHNDAYKKSLWGGLMAGPAGDSIRTLLADWPKMLGSSLLTEPLLEGKPPEELKKSLADLKYAGKIIDLIIDKGLVIGVDVREPTPTLDGVGKVFGTLLNGELPGREILAPDVQFFAIVPDVSDRAEVFLAALRLLMKAGLKIEPFELAGRNGFKYITEGYGYTAFWVEGRHFVFYSGTDNLESAINGIAANARKGGIAVNPLFQKCTKNPGYESVTRGFVNTARLITLARNSAGPFVPGLGQRLQDLGISGFKSITFNSGFEGKESRATYEFDFSERKGLAKIIKQEPLGLKDLPTLPPDMSRFSALRIDPSTVYETAIVAAEALAPEAGEMDEDPKSMDEKIRLRREILMKELDKSLGVSLKNDLLPHLGDKFVIYNSPSEGLSILGTVLCISVKEPAKLKMTIDRMQRRMDGNLGSPVKIRKKVLCGVEIRELYSQAFQIFTPTYAIVDDWLVFSVHPQPVQGFVLRSKGELPVWKPDAATAARMAKLPTDACSLQFCDPRGTIQTLCSVGPLALNSLALFLNAARSDKESIYDPIDIGLMPNAHVLNKHLFPNLTIMRATNKSITIEVNESFSLPLEFLGIESIVGGGFLGAYAGFLPLLEKK